MYSIIFWINFLLMVRCIGVRFDVMALASKHMLKCKNIFLCYTTSNNKNMYIWVKIKVDLFFHYYINHPKYVFICKISFKSEVFLPVHHLASHMDLHSLKIQFKVEYFAKWDFSVCQKNSGFTWFSTFMTEKTSLIFFKGIFT